MKKLKEFNIIIPSSPTTQDVGNESVWLSVLADLKALYNAFQSAHWRAKGDSYYGDHLLYQRIYDDIAAEIDSVAERAIDHSGDDSFVEPGKLLGATSVSLKDLVFPGELAVSLLNAEIAFLQRLDQALNRLRERGKATNGVEDLLQGIASKHEEHVYLLKQRIKN